jgi:HK97 gp10 family phage protein
MRTRRRTVSNNKVNIRGLDVLEAKLRALPDIVERAAVRAVREETHDVAQQMRRDAPVGDTHGLVDGIQEEYSNGGLTGKAVSTAEYSTYVVHGTSTHKAEDFITPAAEVARRRFPQRVREIAAEELRKLEE